MYQRKGWSPFELDEDSSPRFSIFESLSIVERMEQRGTQAMTRIDSWFEKMREYPGIACEEIIPLSSYSHNIMNRYPVIACEEITPLSSYSHNIMNRYLVDPVTAPPHDFSFNETKCLESYSYRDLLRSTRVCSGFKKMPRDPETAIMCLETARRYYFDSNSSVTIPMIYRFLKSDGHILDIKSLDPTQMTLMTYAMLVVFIWHVERLRLHKLFLRAMTRGFIALKVFLGLMVESSDSKAEIQEIKAKIQEKFNYNGNCKVKIGIIPDPGGEFKVLQDPIFQNFIGKISKIVSDLDATSSNKSCNKI